jgi:hypothetical protein
VGLLLVLRPDVAEQDVAPRLELDRESLAVTDSKVLDLVDDLGALDAT